MAATGERRGCFDGPLVRVVVFLFPDVRWAAWRVGALLRLRDGEDARVAMNRRLGDGRPNDQGTRREYVMHHRRHRLPRSATSGQLML